MNVYAIVGQRNPGASAIVDLNTPTNPSVLDLAVIAADGHWGPEGSIYVPASHRPKRWPLAVAACRGSGTVAVLELTLPKQDRRERVKEERRWSASGGARVLRRGGWPGRARKEGTDGGVRALGG